MDKILSMDFITGFQDIMLEKIYCPKHPGITEIFILSIEDVDVMMHYAFYHSYLL